MMAAGYYLKSGTETFELQNSLKKKIEDLIGSDAFQINILLGVSGCGKTHTLFEVASSYYTIFYDIPGMVHALDVATKSQKANECTPLLTGRLVKPGSYDLDALFKRLAKLAPTYRETNERLMADKEEVMSCHMYASFSGF